jgi:hypothetical protein
LLANCLPPVRVGFRYELCGCRTSPRCGSKEDSTVRDLESGVPTAGSIRVGDWEVSMVMIGVDPHKRTHTAVAIDEHEMVVGERLVHARTGQVGELVGWADQLACPDRVWAVESAGGLG